RRHGQAHPDAADRSTATANAWMKPNGRSPPMVLAFLVAGMSTADAATNGAPLRSVSTFASIDDGRARSIALFKSLREICEQIKDPNRNGWRSLAELHRNSANDPLVGWAWHPGGDREPAPGTHSDFGQLIGRGLQLARTVHEI